MVWLRALPVAIGTATRYEFPSLSVTEETLEFELFQPIATMFVSPAVCAPL